MKILLSQKNIFFDILESAGLSPSSFVIQDPDPTTDKRTRICHSNSEFYFSLKKEGENIIVKYSPANELFEKEEWVRSWNQIELLFEAWAFYIIRELSEIDKWQRLQEEIQQVNFSYSNEMDKFSASEYEDLKSRMLLLKVEIQGIGLPIEQIQSIENKIDNLTEIALTLTKFDWKSLFVGTIISIIIQLAVTPENAKAIWDLIKKVFNQYLLP